MNKLSLTQLRQLYWVCRHQHDKASNQFGFGHPTEIRIWNKQQQIIQSIMRSV